MLGLKAWILNMSSQAVAMSWFDYGKDLQKERPEK